MLAVAGFAFDLEHPGHFPGSRLGLGAAASVELLKLDDALADLVEYGRLPFFWLLQ
jgi:hypothetical protein